MGPSNPTQPTTSAHAEYEGRLAARQTEQTRLEDRERWVGNIKVVVFLGLIALAVLAFGAGWLSGLWLIPVAIGFLYLLFLHENVTRALYRSKRAVAYYRYGLARLDGRWSGFGQQGERFKEDHHPYAADLDLFGHGSLFELLCTARTRGGEDTLAAWLNGPAGASEVAARQAAVAELSRQLDLREDLALLGDDLPSGVDFSGLAEWGRATPTLTAWWPRIVAAILGCLAIVTLFGWLLAMFDMLDRRGIFGQFFYAYLYLPFLAVGAVELVFAGFFLRRVQQVLSAVEKRARDLTLLAHVLERLESAKFTAPRLVELRAHLEPPGQGAAPSQCVAQLVNLIDLLNSRHAMLFTPIAYLLLWGTQLAHALEAWRRRCGPAIGAWLEAVGQIEALCSLAGFSFENPGDPFPEVIDGPKGICEAEGLAHPLLPPKSCVRNDLSLTEELRVLIISGSNMSGKSTYLRTIGINVVLALAGAPVRAKRLRLTPLAVGATLRIQDSLQEGVSRFKAEVMRVRQVVDLSRGPLPLLFLLDEIFAGTNSHDRKLGAEAVVKGLVRAGAIGLVTTHDLSLTQIADDLGAKSCNVHFADRLEEGLLHFDYRLRPGVVQHSNALALMRAVGLDV